MDWDDASCGACRDSLPVHEILRNEVHEAHLLVRQIHVHDLRDFREGDQTEEQREMYLLEECAGEAPEPARVLVILP